MQKTVEVNGRSYLISYKIVQGWKSNDPLQPNDPDEVIILGVDKVCKFGLIEVDLRNTGLAMWEEILIENL